MEIIKENIFEVDLRDIKRGEAFLLEGEAYMKISYDCGSASYILCVSLFDGITHEFSPDHLVIPLNAKVIVSCKEKRS